MTESNVTESNVTESNVTNSGVTDGDVPGELGDEDQKLVILARGARARASTTSGAAVRDGDGRTYAGADVTTDTLTLSGLQVAVATALSSGADAFEAAVVVNGSSDDPGRATLVEIAPSAYLILADTAGVPVMRLDATR